MNKPVFFLLLLFVLGCSSPEDHVYHPPGKDSNLTTPIDTTATVSKKTGPQTYVVEIRQMKFEPADVAIHKGDTVVWINHDLVTHCITEEKTKAWTSAQLQADSVWKKAFLQSADYYCAIHQVMKGKVTVQ